MLHQLPLPIKEYYSKFPTDIQQRMLLIRENALKILGSCEEKMAYGLPTFKKKKNIFHYGAFKNHIGLYPGAKGVTIFIEKYPHYPFSKGTIQILHQNEFQWEEIKELMNWCNKNYSQF